MALRTRFNGRLGASAIALTVSAFALPAVASAQDANAPADEGAADSQEIVVTGFRASLQNAVNVKKRAETIVESVSAEDIGKLPDASIGESIARLPGLTSQRLAGRANSVAIRGLGPDLSSTTMNGRPQTSTGEQRNVEFDQYPSETVSRVDVYKTPMASLIHQGLVGTVDIRTIRPLEIRDRVLSFGARGTYVDTGKVNAESRDKGFRVTGTYADKFANDTIGVALSAAYTDDPYQSTEFEAWGYNQVNGNYVVAGIKPFGVSSRVKRAAFQGTLQWQPTDTLTLTADGFYSHFTDKQIKRGIEFPLAAGLGWSAVTLTPTGTEGNLVTSGTFGNIGAVVNNHGYERNSDIFSGGFNAKYDGDDGWSAMFDFGYSRTDRNELSLETNAGTPNVAGKVLDTLNFVSGPNGTSFTSNRLNYADPNLIVLTDPLGWGGGAPTGHQEGYYNDRIIDDEIKSFQTQVAREFEDGFVSKVSVGLAYTDRKKSKTPVENYLNLANGARTLVLPTQYRLPDTNLAFVGAGPMLSYDPFQLLADGVYVAVPNISKDIPAKAYQVTEQLMSMYLQADLRGSVGDADLTGNVGVLATNTAQRSRGIVNLATFPSTQEYRTEGADYWDVLPSLNLALRFPSDFVVRFAAAREIQRPRLDDLKVSREYSYSTTNFKISGSGGNPQVRPYRAWAADLNFEKYFAAKGYLGLQLFYKKFDSFIYRAPEAFDYSGLPITVPPGLPVDYNGTITQPTNVSNGSLYGAELAGTLPFEIFTSALEGFGITGGVGYTETSITAKAGGTSEDIPDYSKWVANATVFFEKAGFNARGSVRYRSDFLGKFVGFGGELEDRRVLAETVIDAQVGYDFQPGSVLEGLSLYLQGQNLTNEPQVSVLTAGPMQVKNYFSYGRRYMAGFTYKF
ncbi:iron complex outermembrane receptor protein [Novosphingobium kunmingense]|uniref:Iron complex outermembrane receptor protein n=1 Tax=Novosphingobium kunmingense TaxID=1211806 RepID=A0A2N0HK50_9SPHN|nr:TonB-dependent receptor [Novosphingobium kunmingense]PKB19331.1 iron complex outermembrane receptor protein [Novosphingobium kunmingense]